MSHQPKSQGGQYLDSEEIITYLREAHKEENLIQMILYAHLVIEQGLTQRIADKLARPKILEDDRKYGRWSFQQKISLYVGLVNPPKDQEDLLFAFNKLRNGIAHRLEDERKCVWECLPWKGKQRHKPDIFLHLLLLTIDLLEKLEVADFDKYINQE
jgi:hypothetical protein